jgi:hypothetical protein
MGKVEHRLSGRPGLSELEKHLSAFTSFFVGDFLAIGPASHWLRRPLRLDLNKVGTSTFGSEVPVDQESSDQNFAGPVNFGS